MKCFVVGIKKGRRHAVFAALCGSENKAARKVLSRNTGWEVEFVKLKQEATVFRIYDDDWYENEPVSRPTVDGLPASNALLETARKINQELHNERQKRHDAASSRKIEE